MNTVTAPKLAQRADYTHRHNIKAGRHGWLRLTPAYSVKVVDELIQESEQPIRIFDPFCGTATTALCAAYRGHEGVTTDINPFLVWLGQAKTAIYSEQTVEATLLAYTHAIDLVTHRQVELASRPPIHNIERWWTPTVLTFLQALKAAIENVTDGKSQERTLLMVAFCRTLIKLSNASFSHQSMSFMANEQFHLEIEMDMAAVYGEDVRFVLQGATDNPDGTCRVVLGDSRNVSSTLGTFDRIITSPPYANRMSYIRELRPYMYWLDFLVNGRDAGELDWSAIGGTWGIATSRLNGWNRQADSFDNVLLNTALEKIAHADNANGGLLSNYIAKYFADMWKHFCGLLPMLAPDADLHYIVGNSTFYGVLLPVEEIYAAMLARLGFTSIECRPIRKRNSKKELIEFDVAAIWPG